MLGGMFYAAITAKMYTLIESWTPFVVKFYVSEKYTAVFGRRSKGRAGENGAKLRVNE